MIINVVVTGTWITDPTDLTSVNVFKTDRVEQASKAGTVRTYAGGRRRIITTPEESRTSSLTLYRVSGVDVETMRAWRGRVLLIRDGHGWRRWGTFFDLAIQSVYQGPDVPPVYTVGTSWTDVDYTEPVA